MSKSPNKSPPLRGVPDPADLDDSSRSVVEKGEALARDHLAKREIRIRKERVRRLNKEEDLPAEDTIEQTQLEEAPEPEKISAPEPSRTESDPRGLKKSRLPKPEKKSAVPSRVQLQSRKTQKKKPKPPLPKPPEDSAPDEAAMLALSGKSPGMLDWVAMELEELLRDGRAFWAETSAPGRVAFLACIGVAMGVFLPWVSDPAHPAQLGLFSGGVLHLALVAFTLFLMMHQTKLVRGVAPRQSRQEIAARGRRVALWQILIGGASTLLAIGAFVFFGAQHAPPQWPVRIRYGLYLTTFFGMGLAYGGLMHFRAAGRRRQPRPKGAPP
jgi:hypothetical protein